MNLTVILHLLETYAVCMSVGKQIGAFYQAFYTEGFFSLVSTCIACKHSY